MNINKHGAVQCGAPKNKNHTNKQTNKKWYQERQYLTQK
jgi:hypothetical protein